MSNPPRLTELRNPSPLSLPATKEAWQGAVRSPNARLRRRFDRTIGFWLGGALLGVGGCILGICMPYRHPVAVTISVLWWGMYLGCFGASIGALLGLWAEQPQAPPSQRSDGSGEPSSRADSATFPAGYGDTLIRDAPRDRDRLRSLEAAHECSGIPSEFSATAGDLVGSLKSS
jgi:hypothetical protein